MMAVTYEGIKLFHFYENVNNIFFCLETITELHVTHYCLYLAVSPDV